MIIIVNVRYLRQGTERGRHMKRVVEAEKEYRKYHGQKAIDQFFKAYPELEYDWKGELELMLENGEETLDDFRMADGTRNDDWCYSIHLEDSEDFTYICVILRA